MQISIKLRLPQSSSMPWWRERQPKSCGPRSGPVILLVHVACLNPSQRLVVLRGLEYRLTCFLSLITLKRSKSVNALLLTTFSRVLAHVLLFHFDSTCSFSQRVLVGPVPAERGSLAMTIGVKEREARGAEWRGTTASGLDAGPSRRTCSIVSKLPMSPVLRISGGTHSLVVDDLNNGSELVLVWSSGEKDNTANLDQSPCASLDLCVTHYVD